VWLLAGDAHDPAYPGRITRSYPDVELDPGVSVPPLTSRRHGLGAAVVDGVLYGVGGAEGRHHADRLAGAFRL